MSKRVLVFLCAALLIGIAGWYASSPEKQNGSVQISGQAQAATVTTVKAVRMDVPVLLQANGYLSSLNSVDIRPQVSNVVAKVHIREGQFVKEGERLFSLDDRADRVNLQKAEAQLAKDKASLGDLERQLARSLELFSKSFIAQSAVDTVQSQVEAQRATVQADIATINAARVGLGYQTIRAPSAGRAGVISVFAGSLVQPGSPPMVTIVQLDPIAATFTLPETELAALLDAQQSSAIKVTAHPQDAKSPIEGKVSFVDNIVDSQNGTIKVKAIFPNPRHSLWPGQYVAVSTTVRELKDAIVIPQAAIITNVDSNTVYVVGADNTVQPRRIELIYSFGERAVVEGAHAGEVLVVDGKQNLRPGMKIREAATTVTTATRGEQSTP